MTMVTDVWNELVFTTLDPGHNDLSGLNDKEVREIINRSKDEQEKMRNLLIEGIIDRPRIMDKQAWVQINQTMLIRMLDKLHAFKQSKNWTEKIHYLFDAIIQHFQSTLDFIEDFFSNYFDRNKKVPVPYLLISIEELCRQLELLKEQFKQRPINNKLVDIVCNNFNRFCQQRKSGVTYNQLMYQKDLMNELLTDGAIDSEENLMEVLFYFNFNNDHFINYLYESLRNSIELLNKRDKIITLSFKQKSFNQLAVKLDCSLSSHVPGVKEQVNHWIDEEVKFLERNTNQDISETSVTKSELFVQVPFKGSEIYLLHKSFLDAGGAPAENYKSLLEKTSGRLSNKNQRGFSPESLKKASDKVDPEAKENVKRFLQRMIRNIDSYN
jgi:hypothetical protein